jgi:hypothetical protein
MNRNEVRFVNTKIAFTKLQDRQLKFEILPFRIIRLLLVIE